MYEYRHPTDELTNSSNGYNVYVAEIKFPLPFIERAYHFYVIILLS